MDPNFMAIMQQLAVLTARVEELARVVRRGEAEEVMRDREEIHMLVQLRGILTTISGVAVLLSEAAYSNWIVEIVSTIRSPLLSLMLAKFALSTSHWGRYVVGAFGMLADPLSTTVFYGLWGVIASYQKLMAVWQSCRELLPGEPVEDPPQVVVVDSDVEQPPAPSLFQWMVDQLPSLPAFETWAGPSIPTEGTDSIPSQEAGEEEVELRRSSYSVSID
jgi:hypothetical protein